MPRGQTTVAAQRVGGRLDRRQWTRSHATMDGVDTWNAMPDGGHVEYHVRRGHVEYHVRRGHVEYHVRRGHVEYHVRGGHVEYHARRGTLGIP